MTTILNESFWDCECERDYIHPKAEKECELCGANSESQPDSWQDEIPEKWLDKFKEKINGNSDSKRT